MVTYIHYMVEITQKHSLAIQLEVIIGEIIRNCALETEYYLTGLQMLAEMAALQELWKKAGK